MRFSPPFRPNETYAIAAAGISRDLPGQLQVGGCDSFFAAGNMTVSVAGSLDALAQHLVSLSNRATNPKGLCVLPGGGDLAFALAETSGFYVVAQEPSPAAMQAACAKADQAGLLGRRMTVIEGAQPACAVADCSANLYVLTGVTDGGLPVASDVLRKLAPQAGQAVVGLAAGEAGTKADPGYANTVFDPLTGVIDPTWAGRVPVGSACGSVSQSPFFHCGSWGITYDFGRGLNLTPNYAATCNDHRNNCNAVGLFAAGMLFAQAYECSCNYKTPGQIMEISRGSLAVESPADATRLRQAGAAVTSDAPALPNDWPEARANDDRSAASAACVPGQGASGKVLWTRRPAAFPLALYNFRSPDTAYDPPQPVVVGDVAYVSGADGALRALSLSDGQVRWTHYTGGRLFQSPAWWRGRVLAGSGDGFVYCLDAASGRELWRFQAAPLERRMFVYGHMVSTWAVATGVMVHGDRAFFGAGLLNNNGAHWYGLDAATGALQWQRNTIGGCTSSKLTGFSPVGLAAIAGEKLRIRRNAFSLQNDTAVPMGDGIVNLIKYATALSPWIRRDDPPVTPGQTLVGGPELFHPVVCADRRSHADLLRRDGGRSQARCVGQHLVQHRGVQCCRRCPGERHCSHRPMPQAFPPAPGELLTVVERRPFARRPSLGGIGWQRAGPAPPGKIPPQAGQARDCPTTARMRFSTHAPSDCARHRLRSCSPACPGSPFSSRCWQPPRFPCSRRPAKRRIRPPRINPVLPSRMSATATPIISA